MQKNKRKSPDKKIVLTGGGSAGHVTPNLALIKKLRQENWQIYYLGSKKGLEKELITALKIPYFAISTGKLRRYFSWRNFCDPLKIIFGIWQSWIIYWRIRPKVVFSKGGFVSFPAVFAAWLKRIPVIVHESDLTPGLANRLSFPFAKKICLTSKISAKHIAKRYQKKLEVTGTPIREELFQGKACLGRKICHFNKQKKVILVQGGGLGADDINKLIRKLLPKLLPDFQVVHLCGKGKEDARFNNLQGYSQFVYLNQEFADVLACADLVISRAGANSVYELLALKKPHILLPLSKKGSRGDQLLNAQYGASLGLSRVINPDKLTAATLYQEIYRLKKDLPKIRKAFTKFHYPNAVASIYDLICTYAKR